MVLTNPEPWFRPIRRNGILRRLYADPLTTGALPWNNDEILEWSQAICQSNILYPISQIFHYIFQFSQKWSYYNPAQVETSMERGLLVGQDLVSERVEDYFSVVCRPIQILSSGSEIGIYLL